MHKVLEEKFNIVKTEKTLSMEFDIINEEGKHGNNNIVDIGYYLPYPHDGTNGMAQSSGPYTCLGFQNR